MNRRAVAILLVGILLVGGVFLLDRSIRARLSASAGGRPPAQIARPTITPTASPTRATRTPRPSSTATLSPSSTPTASPTPIVTPSATPPPPTPTPTPGPIVTNDKLGIGVYSSNIPISTLRVFRPAMILIQDPEVNTAQVFRTAFPKALIVGRHFVPDNDPSLAHCNNPTEDHYAKGKAFADALAPTAVALKGVINAWVSDNEQTSDSAVQDLPCHAQFQLGFIEELQGKYGIAAVAGNDGSGALQPADYPKYFAKPISEARYFGMHAYGKPEARSLQTGATYYALRYRLIYQALMAAHVPPPPGGFQFLLTETGLYQGWRGMVPDGQMAQSFIWLEQQTEQDPYVRGQFIFGLGMSDRFKSFELQGTSLIEQLGQFNLQHAGTP
ncbi:MAG: hypothetical protein ACYDAG_16135 [Chloroflexota bacterium]